MRIIRNTQRRKKAHLFEGYGNCVICGGPADALSRHGEYISGGYDSDFDALTFAIVKPVSFPEGRLCNGCVKPLVDDGTLEHTHSFGALQRALSAEAYAVVFRSGQAEAQKAFAEMKESEDPDRVQTFLTDLVWLRTAEPRIAGMLAALLTEAGIDMTGADETYAEALHGEEAWEKEMLEAMITEMEKTIAD